MIDLFELFSLAVSMKLPWLFELFSLTVNPSNDYPVHCVWISPILQPTDHFSPMLYIYSSEAGHSQNNPYSFRCYTTMDISSLGTMQTLHKERKGLVPSLGYILQ